MNIKDKAFDELIPAKITLSEDEKRVIIERNEPTLATAKTLSDYLHTLDSLTTEQNDKPIELIYDHLQEAERGAVAACTNMILAAYADDIRAAHPEWDDDEPLSSHNPPIQFKQ